MSKKRDSRDWKNVWWVTKRVKNITDIKSEPKQ